MKQVFLVIWPLLFLQGVATYKLICVYTNWSQYRPDGGKFFPEDIDPSLCTHLIYVYAKLQGNKLAPTEWNDDGNVWREGMFKRVNALKQTNLDLKTLLGVGGWMMGSKDFSRMASTRRSRRIFAKSTVSFLRKRDFDGLTIDWQHPTKRGGRPRDRVNFSFLLQEVRRAIEEDSQRSQKPPLLLAVGVSASKYIIDSAYEINNISKYADLINVFAYDLHGHWENYTGHPSPLYAREDELGPASEINIDASMKYWISSGVDRSKLVLGISTYGRTFTLQEPQYNGYMVPTKGPGIAGDFTREPGMIAYYERCSQYFFTPRVWDKKSKVAYWHSDDQWIAGEDVESIRYKVYWARRNGVDGFMMWSLDTDDFSGSCDTGKYRLHKALKDELDSPTAPPTTTIPPEITEATEQMSEANTSPVAVIYMPRPTTKLIQKPRIMPRPIKKKKDLNNTNRDRSNKPQHTKKKQMKEPQHSTKAMTKQKAMEQDRNLKKNENSPIGKGRNKISNDKNEQPTAKTALKLVTPFKIKDKNVVIKSELKNNIKIKSPKLQGTLQQVNTVSRKTVTQTKHSTITPQTKKKITKIQNEVNEKSPIKKNAKRIAKPRRRKPNRRKGRRRKLTKAQRLRIIQHRRRLMMRRQNARKPSTAKPNITTMM